MNIPARIAEQLNVTWGSKVGNTIVIIQGWK
jgi:hypothetical protein